MNHLHQHLAQRVDQWRADGYLHPQYPALAEILEWAREGETETLRFLRHPQLLIVEVKAERERGDPLDGENGKKAMALRRWETLNPNRLKYQMIFTATNTVPADEMSVVRRFVEEPCT